VTSDLLDLYVAGFVDRVRWEGFPGQRDVDAPGMQGLLGSGDDSQARLLVVDDRAHDALAEIVATLRSGIANVFPGAPRCAELLRGRGWRETLDTAMVRRDLDGVPAAPLTSELSLQLVRRLIGDPAGGPSLRDAVDLTMLADPQEGTTAVGLLAHLQSLPPALRLYAAVDRGGAVVGTSGVAVYDQKARVVFVNTHPDWRRRGIARALTAHALREARRAGAQRASLDATDLGRPVYERLGFECVAPLARFSRFR
jgi:GNAT superfamily N-acetyltransferase